MREIKFRAWDTTDKVMRDVTTMNGDKVMFADDTWDWYKRERILMQYTGLKDKNGKEIYEGDIVKGTLSKGFSHMPDTGVVKYGWMAYVVETPAQAYLFAYFQHGSYEVIGNICEHPHLLKGDEEHAQAT